jgi:hypothetical protein
MNLQKINVKVYLEKGQDIPLKTFIPLFHGFIQKNLLEGLLVDVAEYTHVHEGPGVLLIAHEGNYSLDETGGKRGLLYNQKRSSASSGEENLKTAWRRALKACELLENEPELAGKIKFNPSRMRIFVNDRLESSGEDMGSSELKQTIRPLLESLTGSPVRLLKEMDPRKLTAFEVEIEKPMKLKDLIGKV